VNGRSEPARGIPAARAIEATGASALLETSLPQTLTISIDSRTLARGETYLALHGASFDGHAFVADALAAGAAALIVSAPQAVPAGVPALVVADTQRALLALGATARALASQTKLVAITGSAGKTTTKTLLAHLLERVARGRVIATPANENNEIGVSKLLLSLAPDTAYAVVELGARHAGDIAPLAGAARPDVAILTGIGDAHLEIFGSRDALADTKWAIFAGGVRPVLNAADATSRARARSLGRSVVWFAGGDGARSVPDGDASVALRMAACGYELAVRAADESRETLYPCAVALAGAHNLANLAAAAAGAFALGIEPQAIAAACAGATLPAGRYERIELGEFAVIYDAYNASTSGMLATLASFAAERAGRRIAVLGSMAELGDDAAALHARVGAAAAHSGLDALLVGGDFADDLARGARAAGLPGDRIVRFDTNGTATAWLARNARRGDLVLLKASRRYKLEEIVAGLASERARTAPMHG